MKMSSLKSAGSPMLGMVEAVAIALSLLAAGSAAGAERVGDLGRKECLAFEGVQAFSGVGIVRQMEMRLEFYGRSDPDAPLEDYLAWIERIVRQGYQRSGFAKAAVTAKADRPAQRIHVSVAEGPRFTCGAVRVTGLQPTLVQQLTNRLREAAAQCDPAKCTNASPFPWPWREGDSAPADPASLASLERGVAMALAELNQHQAEAQIELSLDESRRRADLLVHVKNPGVAGTLGQIEIQGLQMNSREDLLSFLDIRLGMPLIGNVTNDASRRLWNSGRFSGQLVTLSPLTEPGQFRLDIAVVEFTNAPPIKQELTAEERACLKLREWILNWQNRPEDWVLETEMRWNGRRTSAEVVQGHEGLAILIRQPSATNTPSLRYGLIAAPQHIGFYSGSQRSKLMGKTMGGQVQSHLAITGNPMNDNARGCLNMGVGWRTGSGGGPYSLLLDLAPVAFVAGAHPQEGVCRIEEGILSVRSQADADPAFEMTAEAATGRLIAWRVSARTNDAWLVLRCQEGAFARALREVVAGSAAFTNTLDSQRPWSSSLAMLGRDFRETVKKDLPEIFDWLGEDAPGVLNAKDWLDAVTMLGDMPWRELLAPLDFSTRAPSEPDGDEDFPFVLEEPLPGLQAGNDWVRLLGGIAMRANDTLWPRGSWPWAVMRDAVFLAAGEARWATNDISRLTKANDMGPLGHLLAAHALGHFDPRLAVTFSQQGVASTTPAALQEDLRLLLRGEEAGQQFLRGTLRRAPAFSVQNLRTFMRLIGTNALPVVLDGFATMSTSSNLPPDEALRPVVERHWEKEIRPWLLTAFANLCLTGYQATSPRADSSQAAAAAGWLLEAAELGHVPAQMLLGRLYTHGLGVTANPATAAMWMRKAAERGYPHAACELGRLYAKLGNQDEAARWFRIGAQDNCSSSEIGLAQLLLGTSGVTREQQEEGLGLLRKASEHGSVEARFYLGMVYEHRKQIEEAVNYYREAAVKGLVQAQMKLAELLTDGFSMKPDFVEAWVWCKQAAAQGNRLAAAQVRSVERKLTAEQMEDARRRLKQIENAPRTEGPGRERSGN